MAKNNHAGPRLALIADPLELSGSSATALLSDALEEGWDAHLIWGSAAGPPQPNPAELPKDVLSSRVHPAPIAMARSIGKRPLAALGAARPGMGPPRRALRALVAGLAPQLVHLPSARLAVEWIGLAGRVGARVLVSVTSEEMSTTALESPETYRPVWAAADLLHAESPAVGKLLQEQGVDPDLVSVIPPAVDEQLLAAAPAQPRTPEPVKILSVGPLSWTQGYEHTIHAVKLLHDRGIPCQYRIVGAGAHRDAVVFARHQLGAEAHVELLEPAGHEVLRTHLRWADVLLSGAIVASSPKTILDAQAAGVLVVTTEPPEDAADSARVVPSLDPEAMSEALTQLVRDQSLRARLASKGRQRALEAPRPAEQTARLRELHRRLVRHD